MMRKTFSIVRDGQTFELTPGELYDAYCVEEDNFNVDDVVNNVDEDAALGCHYEDATDEERDRVANALKDEKVIKEIAERYYTKKDNDDSWYYLVRNAAAEVIDELIFQKRE